MAINGSWMLAGYRDNEYTSKNCDVAVLPYTKDPSDRVSIYNGLGWAASATTKNPDAAWSLIEYLLADDEQLTITLPLKYNPTNRLFAVGGVVVLFV